MATERKGAEKDRGNGETNETEEGGRGKMIYIIYYFFIGAIIVRLSWRGVLEYLNDDDTRSRIFNSPALIILQHRNWLKPMVFIFLVFVWPGYLYALILGGIRIIRIIMAIWRIKRLLKKYGINVPPISRGGRET